MELELKFAQFMYYLFYKKSKCKVKIVMFYACMNLLPSKLEVSCQIEFIKSLLDVALMFYIKLKIIKNTVCLCKMHLQKSTVLWIWIQWNHYCIKYFLYHHFNILNTRVNFNIWISSCISWLDNVISKNVRFVVGPLSHNITIWRWHSLSEVI